MSPHEEPVFFIDRCLGKKKIAQALRDAGLQAEIHDDHFRPDAADTVWLAEVGKKGWIVLSKDRGIKRRTLERQALSKAGVGAFILTGGSLKAEEMAMIILKALPRIRKIIEQEQKPFIATVTKGGQVSLLGNI